MNTVTIIRKWDNPQVTINVTNESIELSMSLDSFVRALTDEVAEPLVSDIAKSAGNPSLWFTKETLVKKLVDAIESKTAQQHFIDAAERIVETVKKETTKVL